MSMMWDGGFGLYHFELKDNNGNTHYYEVCNRTREGALSIAKKWFKDKYSNECTVVNDNVTGKPLTSNL